MTKVKKHPHAGKSGPDREFIKLVGDLARSRNHREVFDDFLELSFCAIAKTTYPPRHERAEALEARYMETINRHEPDYIRAMPKLLGCAAGALASGEGGDFLGRVSGELGALNEHAGQFFTPFDMSKLMAEMVLGDVSETVERQGFVTIHEPACGAGGMILAAADVIAEQDLDPRRVMYVEAVDISHTAYKMTYLQLSLRGIPATVVHGDTLNLDKWDAQHTPALFPFIAEHGERFRAWSLGKDASVPQASPRAQLDLFAGAA